MRARRPRPDESGVSVVIGAILILGLLVATTVTIRLNYEPIWERDREALHMRTAEGQLAAIKGEIDRQIDNRTTVPVAHPLALGTATAGLLGTSKEQGLLSFTPANRPVTVSTNRFLVQQEGGSSFLGLQETWTPISGATNVENVGIVHSLRLRLASAAQTHAGDAVTITATNRTSAFAGDLRVLISASGPSSWTASVRVRDATSNTVAEVVSTHANDQAQSPLWIDALRADYRFDRLLAASAQPVRLTFAVANVNSGGTNTDLSAEYALTFRQAGTQIIQGGAGLLRTDYTNTFQGGQLRLHAPNHRYPVQDLSIEHGALLLEQPDGAAFRVNPAFQAALSGGTTSLVMTLPSLTGPSSTHQGDGTATVYTSSSAPTSLSGQAPRWTITLTTDRPDLWTNFWTSELASLPGFVAGTHFTTTTTATTASLTVYGLTSDPASTTYDLHVVLRQAQIAIEIQS